MDIKVTFPGGKKVNAEVGKFVVTTDQSVEQGGEGSAPNPFMLFLASIGACAGIYVLSFCKERDISTEGLSLNEHLEYSYSENGDRKLSKIVLEIIVPPTFPEKYLNAIIKVANQCTVKKAIMNPPVFEVKTVKSS